MSGSSNAPGVASRKINGSNPDAAFPPGGAPANYSNAQGAASSDIDIQKLNSAYWKSRGKDPLLNPDLIRIFEQLIGRLSGAPAQKMALLVPPEYVQQAQRLFDQYLRYRDDLANIKPMGLGQTQSEMLNSVVAARSQLQQKYFSESEISGLFAEDNQYDLFSVERLRIKERNDLTTPQKEEIVARLATSMLSAEQQQARQAAMLPARIAAQNVSMDTSDATPEQRQDMRSAEFGEAAAVRMAEVDQREAEWQHRIAQLAAVEPAVQQHMRLTLFTPTEQLRLDAALALYRSRQAQNISKKP